MPDPHDVLPGGEHLTHVVEHHCAAYICRRNVLIGLSSWGLIMANGFVHSFGGITAGAVVTPFGPPLSCLFRCHSGSFTPARFVDRTAAQSWARQSSPGPSLRAVLFVGYGLFKAGAIGNAGLVVYGTMVRFHADHLGGPCKPVFTTLSCCGQFRRSGPAAFMKKALQPSDVSRHRTVAAPTG